MTTVHGDLPLRLREQAEFCAGSGAPLYAHLLRAMAGDVEAGGPTAQVLQGPWGRGSAVQLRLLAAVHRRVLSGDLTDLAPFCRSVGGQRAPEGAWPIVREVLGADIDGLRAELAVPPQTNEPGRALPLAHGLAAATARHSASQVRLLELGASAGLNLLVDQLPWSAAVLSDAAIVQRRGCDLAPLDPLSPQGRLQLESYVWPDNVERFTRLVQALDIAASAGPGAATVDRAPADGWLVDQLSRCDDGALTVIWHSVMWQYLDDTTADRVLAAIDAARARLRLVHLRFEPQNLHSTVFELTMDTAVLGHGHPHGLPFALGR
jgi:hypothetical protein